MNQEKFDRKYHAGYYEANVSPRAARSARVIALSLIELFSPGAAVDIGCGTGELMLELAGSGVVCWGFDRASYAVAECLRKGLKTWPLNLEEIGTGIEIEPVDLAICMEVAEHIDAGAARWLVRLLCKFAPITVFTAAPPGQGGNGHVNEQPRDYWIEIFKAHDRELDRECTRTLSEYWKESGEVMSCYHENLMVFRWF